MNATALPGVAQPVPHTVTELTAFKLLHRPLLVGIGEVAQCKLAEYVTGFGLIRFADCSLHNLHPRC